jgi:bacillithiol biosynthesis cysteine-adding enzyme BshC
MKAAYIPYGDTNSFSALLLNYLEGDERLQAFYGNRPDHAGFAARLSQPDQTDRDVLADILALQHEGSHTSAATQENIQLLRSADTFTVTTGHQLNIFTGPLYFIFKIATAIRLARDLKAQFPDKNFVPVYWMASEDHDFEEINHTYIFRNPMQWNTRAAGATGRISTADIEETVKAYQNILGLSENSCKLSAMVEEAYLKHATLGEATRSLVGQLFGAYGLVVIDADRRELKKLFVPIMKQDILQQNSFRLVGERSSELEELGFKPQVHAREINFFYLNEKLRERIVLAADGRYQVLNTDISFSEEELIREMEEHPESFSPNVIMRPLYQEKILPNLAYIGGAAEISYWMQLKKVFDFYQQPFPILVPRNSAMIADGKLSEKIYRLNFTYKSIFKPAAVLKREYVRVHSKHRLNLNDEWREFNSIFEKIKLRAHKIDPTLGPSTDAIQARLKTAMNRLEKKLLKADQKNFEEALDQIDRVKDKLFPDGILQERVENFGSYYVKYGDDFIRDLIRHFRPLEFKFTILY